MDAALVGSTVELSAWSRGWLVPDSECVGYVELVTAATVYLQMRSERSPKSAILSLHDALGTTPRSPLSIHLEQWPCVRAAEITVNDRAAIEDGTLRVYGRTVLNCAFNAATEWRPTKPADRELHGDVELVDVARNLIEANARLGSRWHDLERSLADERDLDPSRTEATLLRIIGFGPGLTPSGDDALTGLLLGLRWWHDGLDMFTYLRDQVLAVLDFRPYTTTAISTQMLRLACAGFGNESVHDVLGSISPKAFAHDAPSVSQLCTLGATSGADTLLGLRTAANLIANASKIWIDHD
jgi:hypothetical protein